NDAICGAGPRPAAASQAAKTSEARLRWQECQRGRHECLRHVGHMTRKLIIGICATALVLALLAWGGARLMKAVSPASASRLPVTRVKRGDVTITVSAKGELSGGHTEMLSAPMTGGGDMAITYLREPGEQIAAGDVV